jgi:hypothetical protein
VQVFICSDEAADVAGYGMLGFPEIVKVAAPLKGCKWRMGCFLRAVNGPYRTPISFF